MRLMTPPKKTTHTKQTLSLSEKIKLRTARVSVVGLGYVGLPLAVELAKSHFSVTGIDLDQDRVSKINQGASYISDVSTESLINVVKSGELSATEDFSVLDRMDVVIICVPTPISQSKTPDLSYVVRATHNVAKHIHSDQLIVLESTTHPGTTEEVVLPILEPSGLLVGRDFYLAFSPERVDPGNKEYSIRNTPKIVGGVTKKCGKIAGLLYSAVAETVVLVSSPKVAETTKLFENVFRNVNIALVNELSILCQKMGISVWEVIDAASTKPFGFMRFNSGPGVGGHCIPVDPYYLAAKAKEYDFHSKFIESAGEVNENMPYFVADQISEALNKKGKATKGSKILILGVTYKKDIDDIRESPALKIIKSLQEKGAIVLYNDPYIKHLTVNSTKLNSRALTRRLLNCVDCTVIVTDHTLYNYESIVRESKLVVDTRNAMKGIKFNGGRIIHF